MVHPIYRVTAVECLKPYSLRLRFDDGLERVVDLEPVLEGEMYVAYSGGTRPLIPV